MFIIIKNIYSFKYYWNDTKKKWEGLKDNATKHGADGRDYLLKKFDNNDTSNATYSYE